MQDGDPEEEGNEDPPEPTEEEEWADCLKKGRRARDLLVNVCSALEEEMTKAGNNQRLSKGAKKDADVVLGKGQELEKKVKELLLKDKKAMGLTKAKALLTEIVAVTKEVKEQKKEMSLVANKAASRATTRK